MTVQYFMMRDRDFHMLTVRDFHDVRLRFFFLYGYTAHPLVKVVVAFHLVK